jgi:hypothetical protein
MNYIIFAKIRNYLIKLLTKKIIYIEINNDIIDNYYINFGLNFLIKFNFDFILKYLNIKYFYKLDDIYFYQDYTNNVHLLNSTILNVYLLNQQQEISVLNKFKNYNFNVPLRYFLLNEKLFNYYIIKFKLFKNGKMELKEIDINSRDNNYKKFFEII